MPVLDVEPGARYIRHTGVRFRIAIVSAGMFSKNRIPMIVSLLKQAQERDLESHVPVFQMFERGVL